MKYLFLSLACCCFVACSNGSGVVELGDLGRDVVLDAAADASVAPDQGTLDHSGPEDDLLFDSGEVALGAPDVDSACDGDGGCFLDPCQENADCQSGWCVEHMGEGVCSQLCQEECPPGWLCKQVGASDPDLIFVCVSGAANLCKPCHEQGDCKTVGGAEDVCLDYGSQGAFCGAACEADGECPWGFSCVTTQTLEGVSVKQCVADAGVCPCTAKSAALGLWTACNNTNDFGVCTGKRTCTETGLTECDAGVATAESCNGVDDDCDGEVDEPSLVEGVYVPLCDDGNQCTTDSCAGEAGCQVDALDGGECKDGNACTVGDHCQGGVCLGSPVECDDSNPCTTDSCDGFGGCSFQDNDAVCDDGNVCTVADRCDGGQCMGTPVDCQCQTDADCLDLEDGDSCNGSLVCDTTTFPHQCVVDLETLVVCPPPPADTHAPCLASACDAASGECSLVAVNEGWACNDDDPCTTGEHCEAGNCGGGLPTNCADGNACTNDSCAPGQGCVHEASAGPCSDGDVCTLKDQCADGVCQPGGQTLNCDDGNPCTTDSCDSIEGCSHAPAAGPCNDQNACTEGDLCLDGACLPGQPIACDDANPCTNDSCQPASGCHYALNSSPCSDGDVCTTGDVCVLGECLGAGVLACNDGNPCTDDSCQPGVGCQFVANAAPCDDGNDCTLGDTCQAGWCGGGIPLDCQDDDPCTDDLCVPLQGCIHPHNTAPCSDGDACTIGDSCDAGVCQPGIGTLVCDDGLFCNGIEVCQSQTGCVAGVPPTLGDGVECTSDLCDEALDVVVHVPLDGLCDDKLFCNGVESCDLLAGCLQGLPPLLDDGHECTVDSCDEATDQVVHLPDDAQCDDGLDCTVDSCVAETGCQYVENGDCGGPFYVLTGEPAPATVFDTIAETHYYPNNLVNSIWHGPSNKILTGHGYGNGYWFYDATNGTYTNTPNKGSGDYDRMVFMPKTRVVIHTDNQFMAAPYDGIWVGTIADDGNMSAFSKAVFSDNFTGTCNLMSASASEFMCYTGTTIRHYTTVEGSNQLTYDRTTTLSPAPSDLCDGGCYQGTFAWDGKYYYFSKAGSSSNNRTYQVYDQGGVLLNEYTAQGSGALSGAYFDWSCGRYTTHDGWGNRAGGNLHIPSDGSPNNDSQVYGPQSPYHTLKQ